MIYAEDAPKLERELHRKFLLNQINKTNPRKEFFRVKIAELKQTAEALGLICNWTLAAAAMEYRERLAIDERIQADPHARQHWITHQMLIDPVTEDVDNDSTELEPATA